jgi:uncharacterized protein with HEPN domain
VKQPRDYRDHLDDIFEAARKALEFVEGMDYEGFLRDEKTAYAVVRALEIVGFEIGSELTAPAPNAVKDSWDRFSLHVAVRSANVRIFAERKATYLPTV